MIIIANYGVGNLHSVQKAFKYIGAKSCISSDPEDVKKADKLVLPGVGAFGEAALKLESTGMASAFKEYVKTGKPVLGICLGMQLLFEASEESPEIKGLGLLPGNVIRFRGDFKIPHMGWNRLLKMNCRLFDGLPEQTDVYFVHSYYVPYSGQEWVAATAEYNIEFTAAVRKDNLIATQFHPEKSGRLGLSMLKNFIEIK